MGRSWRRVRNKVAVELDEPSIGKIRLYDLRHYFATMLYHKTKDILYVKQQMGHKKLETTMIYTQLVDFGDEEYTVKIASNVKETAQLLEQGFNFVAVVENKYLLRKLKSLSFSVAVDIEHNITSLNMGYRAYVCLH